MKIQNLIVDHFAITLVAILSIPSAWAHACKNDTELDQCAAEISFFENRATKIPATEAEAIEACGKIGSAIDCVKHEAISCWSGMLRAVMLNHLGNIEKHLDKRCDSAEQRSTFVRHIQCFANPAKVEPIRLCTDRYLTAMERVADMPATSQIAGSCCAAVMLHDCAISNIRSSCESRETYEYFEDMIAEVSEEHMTGVCAAFNSIAKCDANFVANEWKPLKSILTTDDHDLAKSHQYKTIIPTVIKMLKNM